MGFCLNCRYWTIPQPLDAGFEADRIGLGWGACQMGQSIDGRFKTDETLAFAEDAENYRADLRTRPDFGCVQFAENEEQVEARTKVRYRVALERAEAEGRLIDRDRVKLDALRAEG